MKRMVRSLVVALIVLAIITGVCWLLFAWAMSRLPSP